MTAPVNETLTPTPWRVGAPDSSTHLSIWAANGVRVCTLGLADWDRANAELIVASVNRCKATPAYSLP